MVVVDQGPSLDDALATERPLLRFLSRSANVQFYAEALRSRSKVEVQLPLLAQLRQRVLNDGGGEAARCRSP